MSKSLRLLQLEDSEIDAALILRSLRRAGYSVDSECVQSAAEMREALTRGPWDVIISDYRMPSFDAPEALSVLLDTGVDIPFIVVSGTIGEDSAVELMRAGAHDYLMKDRLTRLAPAVEREIRDAARRKQQREAEEALRESERCYRLISEHSGDVVWAYDPETDRFTYISPSVQQMLGHTPSECLSMSFATLFVPDAREIVIARMHERVARFKRGGGQVDVEVRQTELLHKNGTAVPAETTIWFPVGRPERLEIVGVTRDITERRKAEVALHESSLFNEQIVASASEGIVVYDRDLRYRAWNRFMEQMTGIPAEELIGKHPADVFPFLKESGVLKALERALSGEVVQSPDFSFTVKKSGKTGWCVDTSSPLRDAAGEIIGVIGIVHDLTERKRLQDQFNQVQKLEAVGRLAGGVAHDFNNMLTVINGYSELLLAHLGADDPLRTPLQEIHRSGERAAVLTQQLLAFSRKQIIEPKALDLNQLVSDMRNMLRRLIGEDIRFELNLDPALGRILADSGQLTQVVMNLAVNARDAMPNGGALTLATANIEFPKGVEPPAVPGRFVRLTVADTGIGIEPAALPRIFEPFFTTKEAGKGTGLGLSTVYGIVQQSGGWVAVETATGCGTAFHVFLPLTTEADSGIGTAAQPAADLRGSETILVVEDQDDVRRFVVAALRGYGYAVLEASQPGEALLIAESQAVTIHLLLTDIVMPHLTGIELAARLKSIRAGMRVLYMTGHTEQASLGDDFFEAGHALIRKPFSAEALARKIREVLDPWHSPPQPPPAGSDDSYSI